MSLTVSIPDTFNGPMDLLLHLVRRDEMDIHDIPIARLTKAYIEEIRVPGRVDLDEAAEFLDLASRLLDIKSRMLLPPEEREAEDGEEDADIDPRAGLVEALLEYRRFKDAAKLLGDMAEEQSRRYPRLAPRFEFPAGPGPADAAGQLDLFAAFQSLLLKMAPDGASNIITYTEVPTSVRIEQIDAVLRELDSARFSLLLSSLPDRREMVGFFIAMLEMIRQGRIAARQSATFSDIILERVRPPARPDGATAGCGRRRAAPRRGFPPAVPGRARPKAFAGTPRRAAPFRRRPRRRARAAGRGGGGRRASFS